MRRALVAVAALVALTGCWGTDQKAAAPEKPSSAAPSGSRSSDPGASDPGTKSAAIEVRIAGDKVEPNGERVQVGVGAPITLHVHSDRPAELHVHSSPEQELEVKKGESTLRLAVKTPGIVEVEEHHSGTVILQLEVS